MPDKNGKSGLAVAINARTQFQDAIKQIPKTDPWVPIMFGPREYKLEYSFGAVKRVLRETGKNINAGELKSEHLSDPDFLAVVLHAGLITHDPGISVENVEEMMQMRYLTYYVYRVMVAIEATQPDLAMVTKLFGEQETESNGAGEVEIIDPPLAEMLH